MVCLSETHFFLSSSTNYHCLLFSQYVQNMSSVEIYVKSTKYLCKFENWRALMRCLKWLTCINYFFYLSFYHKDDNILQSLRTPPKNKSEQEQSQVVSIHEEQHHRFQHLLETELKGGSTDFQWISLSPSPSEAWDHQHSLACQEFLAVVPCLSSLGNILS